MVWLDRGTTGVNGINGSLFILKAVQFKYQHKLANPAHLMLNHTIKSLSFSVHQTNILKEKKKNRLKILCWICWVGLSQLSTMAGLNPESELVARGKKASHVMESIGDGNVGGTTSGNMGEDGSLMHFPANWSVPHKLICLYFSIYILCTIFQNPQPLVFFPSLSSFLFLFFPFFMASTHLVGLIIKVKVSSFLWMPNHWEPIWFWIQ